MWNFLKYYILLFFFDYEIEEEYISEKDSSQNTQHFLINKKKIITIILILIFLSGWFFFYPFQIPDVFNTSFFEKNLWEELKNCTDNETFDKIFQHVQNIYENPYYRQKELNCLRFIQWTNLLNNAENSVELKECIEKLINQIEKDFKNKDVTKYTSYK